MWKPNIDRFNFHICSFSEKRHNVYKFFLFSIERESLQNYWAHKNAIVW